ncbi:MAG: protein translocase subunit SecF, partial [Clostridia bacterium]|nr:protein translocase subunit SecF [Clostridia bacterium]
MLKNFHFINNKKTTLIIVGAVLLVGILSFVIRGFNIGIDFTGGYEATIDLGETVSQEIADDIKDIITAEKTLGAEYADSITFSETSVKIESKAEMTAEQQNKMVELICEKYTKASTEVDISNISAVIGTKMLWNALLAVSIAAVLMLVYIGFRFEVASGFAAVICLLHDLFIMLVFYSLLQIPITSSVIAAFLTILGYSINATIVVFDRIRENRKKLDGVSFGDVVNTSIHETMGRSVNTTITTVLTIGAIFAACAIAVIVSPTSNLDGLCRGARHSER